MKIKDFFLKFLRRNLFNYKWKCLGCGREIFDGKHFCANCEKQLPRNDGPICAHCGRKVLVGGEYCSTCKEYITSVDKCRSVFVYEKPISTLIKKFKYDNCKFIEEVFSEYLAVAYFRNYFNADALTYVPMTKKAEVKRGYNQSKLLAEGVSVRTGVPVLDCLEKVKETKRQAKLNRQERLKNLQGAFKVIDKKSVKDKKIVIIDDVTTTGATVEVVAERLKKAGAKQVFLITVASTSPRNRY